MKKKKNIIGISCIGSGVGQSVINSLRLSKVPIKTVGLGTNPFAYGAYDCNNYDYTKSIYDDAFIDDLIDKCKKHNIDLIIPGLDDEVMLYAQNANKFIDAGIQAIYSEEALVSICRDKEKMSLELNKITDICVKSYNKELLLDDIENGVVKFPLITKPKGGFASRGVDIIRNIDELYRIKDNHIIQELAVPQKNDPNYNYYISQIALNKNPQVSEISIQLVYNQDGKLLGRMSSYNKLNNGIPIEILPYENEHIWNIIDQLSPTLLKMGLKGPINIQGRLTETGFKIFEMNPRFTGITGLRALMGFNEVEACVKEWLGIDTGNNQLKLNYNRFGTRQIADKSIPLERNLEILSLNERIINRKINKKKTVLITGASGYLGQNLIKKLSNYHNFEIWAFDIDKIKTQSIHQKYVNAIYDNDDIANGRLSFGNVDILLHLGFTRPYGSNDQIADSLKFTQELFSRAVLNHIPAIINISSQSVYGLSTKPLWTEETSVAPETAYAQAKYATELMLQSLGLLNNSLKYCSLRLAALAGGADGLVEVDLLSKITRDVIEGKPIKISGGMQQLEFLDIRDAINAIIRILKSNAVNWYPIYNLGSGKVLSLNEIAHKLIDISYSIRNVKKTEILIEDTYVDMKFGMNSQLFFSNFEWKPEFNIEDTIKSVFKHLMDK